MDIFVWSTIVLAIWAAIGPLVGVRYGQELARRFQHAHWVLDNRKKECQELIRVLSLHSNAVIGLMMQQGREQKDESDDVKKVRNEFWERWRELETEVAAVFNDRIFIKRDIEELNIRSRWCEGPGSMKWPFKSFEEAANSEDEILNEIRGLAFKPSENV